MNPRPRFLAATFALVCLFLGCTSSAKALTNQDIAGVYEGTSAVTLPTGQTITANLKLTIKPTGKLKTKATVNGQTTSAKGKYQFVSEYGITESTDGGEALGFVDLNGPTLTFNLLVRLDDGRVLKEITTVTRIN